MSGPTDLRVARGRRAVQTLREMAKAHILEGGIINMLTDEGWRHPVVIAPDEDAIAEMSRAVEPTMPSTVIRPVFDHFVLLAPFDHVAGIAVDRMRNETLAAINGTTVFDEGDTWAFRCLPDSKDPDIAWTTWLLGYLHIGKQTDFAQSLQGTHKIREGLLVEEGNERLRSCRTDPETVLRYVTATLMYLCDDRNDLALIDRSTSKREQRRHCDDVRRDPPTYTLGTIVGQSIRAHRAHCEPTGRTVRTHVRRGHWHTYLYGPNDATKQPRARWVHQTIINADTSTETIPRILVPR